MRNTIVLLAVRFRCAAVRPAANEREYLHARFAVSMGDMPGRAWLACGIATGPLSIARAGRLLAVLPNVTCSPTSPDVCRARSARASIRSYVS